MISKDDTQPTIERNNEFLSSHFFFNSTKCCQELCEVWSIANKAYYSYLKFTKKFAQLNKIIEKVNLIHSQKNR